MRAMGRPLVVLPLLVLLALAALGAWGLRNAAPATAQLQAEGGLAEQLRYIGRDTSTGMPAPVDDRFIARIEHEIARYGKDERQPVPPPPVTGTDVSALTVPALGLEDVPVDRYGVDAYGRLEVPQDNHTIGWNPAYTSLPGTAGATFFAAHFEYAGKPGVFNRLSALSAGDEITVSLTDGTEISYRVISNIDYALAAIDMGALLQGREGSETITLMTCSGPAGADGYPLRTVVLAERAP